MPGAEIAYGAVQLRVHANEGQCDNVTEMFMACSYDIDGDHMFGVTVAPVAKALEVRVYPEFTSENAHSGTMCARMRFWYTVCWDA